MFSSFESRRGALKSGPSSSSFPKVNVCVPPGGASTLDVGLPVTTLPQFWSRPDAKAFADGAVLLLVVLFMRRRRRMRQQHIKRGSKCVHLKRKVKDSTRFERKRPTCGRILTHVAPAPTPPQWRWLLCMAICVRFCFWRFSSGTKVLCCCCCLLLLLRAFA